MKTFNYFQPSEILFGAGRLKEVGEVVARYGQRCLVVSTQIEGSFVPIFDRIKTYLADSGVEYALFDGVVPNPTTDCVAAGSDVARQFGADVVLGVGGGSSMDTAKAIAVEASHPGTCWDYLWFRETQPTQNTLPVVAVTTTSGTGSQVTQVAVVTDSTTKTKSAIYNALIYPQASIVDPELVVTAPPAVTASTGFDVFCHAFESYLHPACSPYIALLAIEAIRLVAENLPAAYDAGDNLTARENMAWADTLAGLCIANAGVTLPHGIGMTIGGQCPQIAHGQALAVVYPEFTRFTYPAAIKQFATVGRILSPELNSEPDEVAAEKSCDAIDALLKRIGMWLSLEGFGASQDDVRAIADRSHDLPDYKGNPRIASIEEIYDMLQASYQRS